LRLCRSGILCPALLRIIGKMMNIVSTTYFLKVL
jgi:hypothetical protein